MISFLRMNTTFTVPSRSSWQWHRASLGGLHDILLNVGEGMSSVRVGFRLRSNRCLIMVIGGNTSDLRLGSFELLDIFGNTCSSFGILSLLLCKLGTVRLGRMGKSLVRLGHLLLGLLKLLGFFGMLARSI